MAKQEEKPEYRGHVACQGKKTQHIHTVEGSYHQVLKELENYRQPERIVVYRVLRR